MRGRNLSEGVRWLEQGEFDLGVAKHLLEFSYWADCCFKCQQAGEKALKGFLHAAGERDLVGHGMTDLRLRAQKHESDFESLAHECTNLSRYYIATRYPDAVTGAIPAKSFDEEDAKEAVEYADRIVQLVRSKMEALLAADSQPKRKRRRRPKPKPGS